MFQLFGRFAWAISFILGYIVSLGFVSSVEGFKSLSGEESFIIVIWAVILGFLIKKFIFPKQFIEERIRFFAQALGNTHTQPQQNIAPDTIPLLPDIPSQEIEIQDRVETHMDELQIPTEPTHLEEKVRTLKTKTGEKKIEQKQDSALGIAIKNFFKENLLAKIGGILLFLGALFFLNLIYGVVGPVTKLIMGLLFGFSLYGVGVFLLRKGFKNEGYILLGIGILINYLVILSGRYILGSTGCESVGIVMDSNGNLGCVESYTGVLTVGVTFLFLVLNTIFGVMTSLVYNSRVLLIFSFIFAYINPLLIGGNSDTPYVVLGYSLFVALAGVFFIWNKRFKGDEKTLLYITFFGANFLFLIAPFDSMIGYLSKIMIFIVLNVLLIYTTYKKLSSYHTNILFSLSYGVMILFIVLGLPVLGKGFFEYSIFLPLLFSTGFLFSTQLSLLLFNEEQKKGLFPINLIGPLLVIGIISIIFPFSFSIYAMFAMTLLYMAMYISMEKLGISQYRNFAGLVFGVFLVVTQGFFTIKFLDIFGSHTTPLADTTTFIQYTIMLLCPVMFSGISYYLSTKKSSSVLYIIGTIGFIVSTIQILTVSGNTLYMIFSVAVLFAFWGANILLPFINNNFLVSRKDFTHFLGGFISGMLFIVLYIYLYLSEYYPGLIVGFGILTAGIVYFFVAYLRYISLDVKKDSLERNMVLVYAFASLSLLTLSVAFIFRQSPEIISIIWLLESVLILYFYTLLGEKKVYISGLILMGIGLVEISHYISFVSLDIYFLIPLTLISITFLGGTYVLKNIQQKELRIPYDILHIIGIILCINILVEIIPYSEYGVGYIVMTLFFLFLGAMYYLAGSVIQKNFLMVCFIFMAMIHYSEIGSLMTLSNQSSIKMLSFISYIASILISVGGYLVARYILTSYSKIALYTAMFFYAFAISTWYIYDIFESTFVITLYWGILSFSFLLWGITADIIRWRTIGLYILSLTLGKILLGDIWIGLDDAIMRVLALMGVGILMIIISMMYSRKYKNNLSGEFHLENLKS